MSGGGGSNTTKTEPPKYLKPGLQTAAREAGRLYGNYTPQYFQGNTFAGFDPAQEQAMSMVQNRATQGSPVVNAAQNEAQRTISGGYLGSNPAYQMFSSASNSTNPALSRLDPFTQGVTNPALSRYGQFADSNQSVLGGPARDTLEATARGDFLSGDSFNQRFQAAANQINPQVDSAFARSGRLRSGLADAAKTEALGNAFSNLYGQERANQLNAANQLGQFGSQDTANRLSAFGQIGNLSNADVGNQLSAIGQYGQFGQADIANRLSAASGTGSLYGQDRAQQLSALGLAPELGNQSYLDAQQLAGIGSQRQQMSQNAIDDAIARFDFQQNLPYMQLGQYQNALTGLMGGGFGSTTTPYHTNRAAGAMGGALAGAQLGSSFGPWGTAIGAIGGGLLGAR